MLEPLERDAVRLALSLSASRLWRSEYPLDRQSKRHRAGVFGLRTGLERMVARALDIAEPPFESIRSIEADTAGSSIASSTDGIA